MVFISIRVISYLTMAQNEGFFLTLPSDGSMKTFPNNMISQFKTLLPQNIDLTDGEWEVALTEMLYGTSIQNISENEAYFDLLITQEYSNQLEDPNLFKTNRFQMRKVGSLFLSDCETLVDWNYSYFGNNYRKPEESTNKKEVPPTLEMDIIRIQFQPGPYVHPKALISEINEGLRLTLQDLWTVLSTNPEEKNNMQLAYHDTFDRIEYQYNGNSMRRHHPFCIRFPVPLALKMGFGAKAFGLLKGEDMTKWINVKYLAPNNIDLFENLKQMYVYCDIIEPQMVGSNALKLLRVVPVTSGTQDQTQAKWEPVRAEYLKLSKKHFDTIEIQVRTSLGTLFPFISGKSLLKLHFRKVY